MHETENCNFLMPAYLSQDNNFKKYIFQYVTT